MVKTRVGVAPSMPSARACVLLFAGLLLAAPLVAAVAVEPPKEPWKRRFCNALGCVITDDQDADGKPDYVNGAFASSGLVYANLNVNRTNVSWWGGATTEEHEALHGPEDKALGVDSWGYANLTARDGGPGFNDSDVHVLAFWTDHETGEFEAIRDWTVYVDDANRDGRPDRVRQDLLP